MRICFLEGDMSRHGGTERMTAMLANEFSTDNQVWIISLKLQADTVFFKLRDAVQHWVLPPVSGKLTIIKRIRAIRQIIIEQNIDWVINVDTGIGFYGIFGSKGTQAKTITWEHSNFFNNWNSKLFPYFRKFAAKNSDVMVVLTEQDKKNYMIHINTEKPIYVIANPVIQHDFSYNSESKLILSAGLLTPIKGFDLAIQAASKVLPTHPDWNWIICGEGSERDYLESLIRENKLEKQVFLIGSVNNMDEQYQKGALFVSTSKMEGLPMVLLEAKSWGLPIISFDIMTGPSDIVRDGVNGYLVKPYNIEDLSDRIIELVEDCQIRVQFSKQSNIDMDKFEKKHIIAQWKKLMEEN